MVKFLFHAQQPLQNSPAHVCRQTLRVELEACTESIGSETVVMHERLVSAREFPI
ncbi:MAG: hypothetical protein ACFE8Z_09870 [Candidatus Hermodarchaeota archaeon]